MTTRHFSCIVLLLALAASVTATSRECVYTIYVKTGDVSKAGTDSKIELNMYDIHGHTVRIENLEKWGLMSKDHDYFERGNLDIFSGRSKCLHRPVCKLKIGSDGKGDSPGWFIEYFEIFVAMPHETCSQSNFNIHQWLGVDSNELTIVLESCKKYVA